MVMAFTGDSVSKHYAQEVDTKKDSVRISHLRMILSGETLERTVMAGRQLAEYKVYQLKRLMVRDNL